MDQNKLDQTSPGSEQERLNARRRLLKGGLGLAPVSMTMVSRPVLAGTETCQGPTGFQSAPPSRVGATPSCTVGKCKGPDQWSGIAKSSYPNACGDRTFATAFNDNRKFSTLSLYKAIRNDFAAFPNESATDKAMARKLAAAYLNALNGSTFPMSVTQVQQFWQGYLSKSYRPGGFGTTWTTTTQFQNYVNYVMTA